VISFPGATVDNMHHYCIPSIEKNPDMLILHVGTNEIKTRSAEEIAQSVVNLITSVKKKVKDVIVSQLIERGDDLNEKMVQVNRYLEDHCEAANIVLLRHRNILSKEHLNGSKLHLNGRGSSLLRSNFAKFLND
jgi:lysophospholipase L1-like esterase